MISPIKVFHETKCLGKLCSGLHEIRAKEALKNLQGTETTKITWIPLISIKTALQKLPALHTKSKKAAANIIGGCFHFTQRIILVTMPHIGEEELLFSVNLEILLQASVLDRYRSFSVSLWLIRKPAEARINDQPNQSFSWNKVPWKTLLWASWNTSERSAREFTRNWND